MLARCTPVPHMLTASHPLPCRWRAPGGSQLRVAVKAALLPNLVSMLQHEASVYNCLQNVQGVVIPRLLAHGPGLAGHGYYIATELINGQHLTRGSSDKALRSSALAALRALHQNGVVHGDIKCSNILVEGGRAWLLDFTHAMQAKDSSWFKVEECKLLALFAEEGDDK